MRWIRNGSSQLDDVEVGCAGRLDISQTIECAAAWDHEALKDGIENGSIPQWMMKDAMESLANNEECLVDIIAELLLKEVDNYDLSYEVHLTLPMFIGKKPPVSVKEFIARMKKYSQASACNYVAGWIYLQRLKRKVPRLCLNSYNFQRLLTVATMLAAKLFDDNFFCNRIWAKIGGLEPAELNKLELEMLGLLDWRMNITVEEYEACRDLLCRIAWGSNVHRASFDRRSLWSSCPSSPASKPQDSDSVSSSAASGALYRSWSSQQMPTDETEEHQDAGDDYFPIDETAKEDWRPKLECSWDASSLLLPRGLEASFDSQTAPAKTRPIEQSFDSCTTARSQCSTPQASINYLPVSMDRSMDLFKTMMMEPRKKLSLGSSFDPFDDAPIDEIVPVAGRLSILVPGGLDLMAGMC